MITQEMINSGNAQIALYMGYTLKTPETRKSSNLSYNYWSKDDEVILGTENSLIYHLSWNSLMKVVEKIKEELSSGISNCDNLYTINYLLGGGYWFKNHEKLPSIDLTRENLWERVVEYITYINKENIV